MVEIKGDIWKYPSDYKIITTNGFVKNNGAAVMGRGVALQANRRYKDLDYRLGFLLRTYGNMVHIFEDIKIISFPVKHNWYETANLELIKESTLQLLNINRIGKTYAMTRPGCHNGKLDWKDVKPIVSILPNNFIVVDWANQ